MSSLINSYCLLLETTDFKSYSTDIALFAAFVLILPYFAYKIKNSLHILQQNSYFSGKFVSWAFANPSRNMRWGEILPLVVFIILFLVTPFNYVPAAAFGICYIILFLCRKKAKAKKPLVITARVKRLIVAISVITLIYLCVTLLLARLPAGMAMAAVLMACLPPFAFLLAALANVINHPIEKGINRWYYNDAKKRIRAAPGLKVIGVTGSYGKTSCKFILSRMLSEKYNVLMTPESYNTTMGVVKTVRNMLRPEHQVFVCEMGAKYKGDIKEICDLVRPEYGIITSIGPQHLETFKDVETIVSTKFELVDALADRGKAVLNFSSPLVAGSAKSSGAVGYGLNKEAGVSYWAEDISYGPSGSEFTLKSVDNDGVRLKTRLLGRHNILNIVGAAAMARQLGVEYDRIAYAVKRLEPVEHRLQLKRQPGGITVIDDAFNSNLEGAKSAVEVLGEFPKGGRILITPGIIELDKKEYEFNREFGAHASNFCDFVILVGKRRTAPIRDGLAQAGFPEEKVYVASNLEDALGKMRQIAGEGSTVLFENDLPDLYNE